MIKKTAINAANAEAAFGMACQRLVPWTSGHDESPFGAMACFLPATSTSAPDCHDQDEVMIVLSGAGMVRIGDESTDLSVGDVVAVGRNRRHVVENPHRRTLTWLSFYWPLHEPVPAQPLAVRPGSVGAA